MRMTPRSFEAWKTCIVRDCGIDLTPEFAALRLSVYQDPGNPETQKLAQLYGEHHLRNVIQWLQRV